MIPKAASGTISKGLKRYNPAIAPKVKILRRNSQLRPSGDQKKVHKCRKSTGRSRNCSPKLRGSPEYLEL